MPSRGEMLFKIRDFIRSLLLSHTQKVREDLIEEIEKCKFPILPREEAFELMKTVKGRLRIEITSGFNMGLNKAIKILNEN